MADKSDSPEEFREFRESLTQAEAEAEVAAVARIQQAAQNGRWQASAWWLERKYGERWGRNDKIRQEISGPNGLPLVLSIEDAKKAVLAYLDEGDSKDEFINSGSDTTSILSDVLSIEVKTIPVDTTKAIKDIRGLEDVPEDFTDLILYSILAAVTLVAIAIGIYYYQKRKKPVQIIVPKGPVTPPWEIALATLDKIEREAVWKSGNDKLYHSSISEALRTYVEAQLKLPALESTTDETLALLQRSLKQQEAIDFIRQVLVLADLVKFAKEKPLPVEHERSLTLAKQFVLLTKPQVSNDAEKEVNNG
jgi:hypothetical protein